MLEAAEWATIEGLVELLQPFRQVALDAVGLQAPPPSAWKPLLHMLLNTAAQPQGDGP